MENGPWDTKLTHSTAEPMDASTARDITEWGDPPFTFHGCQLGKMAFFPCSHSKKII